MNTRTVFLAEDECETLTFLSYHAILDDSSDSKPLGKPNICYTHSDFESYMEAIDSG